MSRLLQLIAFTPDVPRLRAFYEDAVGLGVVSGDPHWVTFDTAGAELALHPETPDKGRILELVFESRDLDADLRRLRGRGVAVFDVADQPFGRVAHFHDPAGNLGCLWQVAGAAPEGRGPGIASVILNCRHLAEVGAFYRERLGLRVVVDEPHWMELDTGGTRLALHQRGAGADQPLHAGQPLACCFDAPDLDTWVEEMRARGVRFATAPTEEEFGLYAEVLDPDGNVVVFRAPGEAGSLEEELAEPFETDDVPHLAAMRKPVKKGAAAQSHLVVKPEYKGARGKAAAKKPAARRKAAIAGARGAGPAGTRLKPKSKRDVKRVKAKPAIGRLRKAERRSASRKKSATAGASKRRPVKRAVAKRAVAKRAVAKRAARRGGRGRR